MALLATQLRRDRELPLHEIVWVPKARLRYRPVSAIPIDDRILYRALVLDVEKECDGPLTVPLKADFERSALDEADDPYFARADVAAYYTYIDHRLVHERAIEEAARAMRSRRDWRRSACCSVSARPSLARGVPPEPLDGATGRWRGPAGLENRRAKRAGC